MSFEQQRYGSSATNLNAARLALELEISRDGAAKIKDLVGMERGAHRGGRGEGLEEATDDKILPSRRAPRITRRDL